MGLPLLTVTGPAARLTDQRRPSAREVRPGVGVHGLDIRGSLVVETAHNFYPETLAYATVSRLFQGSGQGRCLDSQVGTGIQQQCIQPLISFDLLYDIYVLECTIR